ncbi:hypothetical protein pEaSNUABM54_00086 [Erwinia phage pEa_SNUABM_54]|nr:hypothetical protein pEaSNUABM54_00086 [Erwinia phage pEa_SNUABM_54]
MNYSTLVRDASKVHENWIKTENGQYIAREACTVIIPQRYVEKSLASFTGSVFTLAIFAVVVGGKYFGVSVGNAMVRLSPSSVTMRTFEGSKYIEFHFEAGDVVIPNVAMVRNNKIPYQVYNEFVAKGNVPWFMSYLDMSRLFNTADSHAGLDLKTNHAIFEMLAAVMARDANKRTLYLRQTIENAGEITARIPVYVAFRNIQEQATNTTTKLMGSYFRDALASALVNPSTRLEGFEKLLRL